jgi:hypothetical protein
MGSVHTATFSISVLGTASLLAPNTSEAFLYRNFSATSCIVATVSVENNNNPQTYAPSPQFYSTGQVGNNDNWAYNLLCPITSDSSVSTIASTAALTMYGYYNGGGYNQLCNDGSHYAIYEAQACVTFHGGGGGGVRDAMEHDLRRRADHFAID